MGQEPDAFKKVEGFHEVDGELLLFTPADRETAHLMLWLLQALEDLIYRRMSEMGLR